MCMFKPSLCLNKLLYLSVSLEIFQTFRKTKNCWNILLSRNRYCIGFIFFIMLPQCSENPRIRNCGLTLGPISKVTPPYRGTRGGEEGGGGVMKSPFGFKFCVEWKAYDALYMCKMMY